MLGTLDFKGLEILGAQLLFLEHSLDLDNLHSYISHVLVVKNNSNDGNKSVGDAPIGFWTELPTELFWKHKNK